MNYKVLSGKLSDARDRMNSEQRMSFDGGVYKTVVLPKGYILWRFVSSKTKQRFGAFWVDKQTMSDMMQILHRNQYYEMWFKKENIRNSLNILEDWNEVRLRCKIVLSREVIAHVGLVGNQSKFVDWDKLPVFKNMGDVQKLVELRRGRKKQYIIPRFANLSNNNKWAEVAHFAHI